MSAAGNSDDKGDGYSDWRVALSINNIQCIRNSLPMHNVKTVTWQYKLLVMNGMILVSMVAYTQHHVGFLQYCTVEVHF